jgi:O-acetyl-ADP-ribose deacetylase (regulator of RNase III)
MGKGIALMFKEAFPANFLAYEDACKRRDVRIGRMFVTENRTFEGPHWIINFPTKKDWRQPSKLEWIVEGLKDLRRVIQEHQIRSIALPPLGSGNGGLDWGDVRAEIQRILGDLEGVDIEVYEPVAKYQNVAKRTGVEELTPARVLIAEMIRRYWVLGIECTYLEVQKLGWFLERTIHSLGIEDPLKLHFKADKYGPYSDRLRHLLNALDGTQGPFRRGRSHQREYQSTAAPRSRLSRYELSPAKSTAPGIHQNRIHCFSESRIECIFRQILAESRKIRAIQIQPLPCSSIFLTRGGIGQ